MIDKDLVLPIVCNKYNISYIIFNKDLKIFDFTMNMSMFVEKNVEIVKNMDIREVFYEFVGAEDSLNEVYNFKRNYLHISMISRNDIFYDVNIEICNIENERYFIAMFSKQLHSSISYLQTIQKINQDNLRKHLLKEKDEDYYNAINKKLISFRIDKFGIIKEVNHACTNFFALDELDLLGKHFSDFFHSRENKSNLNSINSIFRANKFDNTEVFFHADVIPLSNEDSSRIIICQDITYLKKIESELEYAVNHDTLTNLPNRLYLMKKIEENIKKSKENDSLFALCFIDLNKFKDVNDNFGHHVGDMLLKHVGDILTNVLRENDTVARLGGDEFVILLENIESIDYLEKTISRIKSVSSKMPLLYSSSIIIDFSFSLGISLYPYDGDNVEKLLDKADKNMYLYKQKSI
ncbi:sensor domain-containing diguanylate cyclase [Aliarcobacter cibarius]|uniref:Diguanylate cyclase n=1 Tax=Aliarcobacter cibarius TaxID=255507 RepID=A0A5J6RKT7_9BACT|nr:sensor domain-containing diguanylate cyclase [Aliarcobacter cibarius]QEZ88951.1 diguanylate cyclase [Aliarcobacter cibarius]QKJ26995.1 diguanylate cyclase [Aliarcobacter cibarius]TLS98505.1 sensor domain-containing diguanylate cyclase [Aliarcobacter cibarius]TLS99185.1 sensor domain-containing diguanylate cyclase [Aliarcobacter cibarius]TLT03650.1 sensor domain-containing diguanylate cyclase [Aliarcobacter cibarius]